MVAPRVLVVDDEETIRFALSQFFEIAGCHVDVSADVAEAATSLARHAYDVAIVDLSLGNVARLEGFDLLDIIRHQYPGTKAIVLSAFITSRVERQAYALGAVSVLEKPTLLSNVVRIVFDVIARRDRGIEP
jgi:DNA-binding NtrC family response regulator